MGQLGDMLYDARRQAAVSLAEISTVTRIRASVLEDLEAGNYDSLPDPGYLRGFVSDYVRYLNLDPEPYLHLLEVETGRPRVTAKNGARKPRRESREPEVSTRHRPHDVQIRPLLIGIAVVVLVGAAIWIGYSLWPRDGAVTPTPTEGSQSTTDSSQTAVGGPFTVLVKAVEGGASDVTLVVDGTPLWDKTLTSADDPIEINVTQSAEISLSNPDSIEVYVNGTAVPVTEPNQIVQLSAPAADQ